MSEILTLILEEIKSKINDDICSDCFNGRAYFYNPHNDKSIVIIELIDCIISVIVVNKTWRYDIIDPLFNPYIIISQICSLFNLKSFRNTKDRKSKSNGIESKKKTFKRKVRKRNARSSAKPK